MDWWCGEHQRPQSRATVELYPCCEKKIVESMRNFIKFVTMSKVARNSSIGKEIYSLSEVADMLGVTKETLRRWDKNGKLSCERLPNGYRQYRVDELQKIPEFTRITMQGIKAKPKPTRSYSCIELFAGAGGMAIGMERAGLKCEVLNEIDKHCCQTLRTNRPHWNVLEGDISKFSFTEYRDEIDVVTGGFPCQAFSYAGKKLGLEDTRGTLFYEFARVVDEVRPAICIGENVRGLLRHDNGKTLSSMIDILDDLGYHVLAPQVLKAIFYRVPQKRERLFIVGIRKILHRISPTQHQRDAS